MRVTEALMYGRMGRSNTMARYRLERASQPLMSGHAIERPSEDPLLANRVEQAKRGARRGAQLCRRRRRADPVRHAEGE